MAYEVGASLSIRNVLNMTPLTLAAKLARMDIFFHILKLEREIYWQIGDSLQFFKCQYQLLMVFREYYLCSLPAVSNRHY